MGAEDGASVSYGLLGLAVDARSVVLCKFKFELEPIGLWFKLEPRLEILCMIFEDSCWASRLSFFDFVSRSLVLFGRNLVN